MKKIKSFLISAVSIAALFLTSCGQPSLINSSNGNEDLSDILKSLSIPDETIIAGGQTTSKAITYISEPSNYDRQFISGCHCSMFLYMLKYDVSRIPDFTYGYTVDWDDFKQNYGGFSDESNKGIAALYGDGADTIKGFPFGKFKIYGDASKIYCIQATNGSNSNIPVFSHFFILTKNAFNTYDICFYGYENFNFGSPNYDFYVEIYKFTSETDFELQRIYLKTPVDTIAGCIEILRNSPEYKNYFYQDFKNNKLATSQIETTDNGLRVMSYYSFADFTNQEYAEKRENWLTYGKLVDSYKGKLVILNENNSKKYNQDYIETEDPLTFKEGYSINEAALNSELERIENNYPSKYLTGFPSNTIEVFTQLDSYKPYDN